MIRMIDLYSSNMPPVPTKYQLGKAGLRVSESGELLVVPGNMPRVLLSTV